MTDMELNDPITRFVHEAGSTPYPTNSLYQIVVSIQRYLKVCGRAVAFFNEQSSTFDTLRKSLVQG